MLHLLLLKWWESHTSIWSSASKLLIVHLKLLDLHLQLFDLYVLHPHLFLNLAVLHEFLLLHIFTFLLTLQNLDVLLQCVELLRLLIDLLEQRHVVLHETLVDVLVLLLIFSHGITIVVKLSLHVSALECVLSVHLVLVVRILESFFLDIGLVHSDHALLQLLEVTNVLQSLVDIVLEALLLSLLTINFQYAEVAFVFETSLPHGQIIDDQAKVGIDSSEVNDFSFHLGNLFMQLLNLHFTRSDVSLQLLDFVIKHEFELLQLLRFLLEFNDAGVLVLNCGFTLAEFSLLRLNLSLEVSCRLYQLFKSLLGRFLLQIKLSLFIFLRFLLAVHFCEFGLGLHTFFDDQSQLILVPVFKHINLFPSFVFYLLARVNVFLLHTLNLILLLLVLEVFLLLLEGVFLLHLLLCFILLQIQL